MYLFIRKKCIVWMPIYANNLTTKLVYKIQLILSQSVYSPSTIWFTFLVVSLLLILSKICVPTFYSKTKVTSLDLRLAALFVETYLNQERLKRQIWKMYKTLYQFVASKSAILDWPLSGMLKLKILDKAY